MTAEITALLLLTPGAGSADLNVIRCRVARSALSAQAVLEKGFANWQFKPRNSGDARYQ
jgi:hypothetical protein